MAKKIDLTRPSLWVLNSHWLRILYPDGTVETLDLSYEDKGGWFLSVFSEYQRPEVALSNLECYHEFVSYL